MKRAGVIERSDGRVPIYQLTDCGQELAQVCLALGMWGARWREVRPEHHDPYLVVWMLSRMIDRDGLPRPRVVVRFDVPAHPRPTGTGSSSAQANARCACTTPASATTPW